VAQLQNQTRGETSILYRLDDGTGALDGRCFLNDELRNAIESGARPEIPRNAYVRVFGKLREMNSKRMFNVDHIVPLQDMNELSYHFLEAALIHAQAKGLPAGGANAGGDTGYGDAMDTGMYGNNSGTDQKLRMCSEDARRFYKFLSEQPQDNGGVNVSDIAKSLRMDLNKCTDCSRQLSEIGLIYSTRDEETWAILEGDW
jgi:replication factor A2